MHLLLQGGRYFVGTVRAFVVCKHVQFPVDDTATSPPTWPRTSRAEHRHVGARRCRCGFLRGPHAVLHVPTDELAVHLGLLLINPDGAARHLRQVGRVLRALASAETARQDGGNFSRSWRIWKPMCCRIVSAGQVREKNQKKTFFVTKKRFLE